MSGTLDEAELRELIGARIRAVRYAIAGERRRQEFLDALGISKSKLDRWESGESEPSALFVVKLNALYGVTADWLFFGDKRLLPYELTRAIDRAAAALGGHVPGGQS